MKNHLINKNKNIVKMYIPFKVINKFVAILLNNSLVVFTEIEKEKLLTFILN